MRSFQFIGLWLLFFSLSVPLLAAETPAAPAPAAPTAAAIEKLALQLGDDDFDTRTEASAQLAKIGEAARAALEKASKSQDMEVRTVAQSLLAKLQLSTVLFLGYDADGKPAAGCSADFVLQGQAANFDNNPNEVPKPQQVVFDAAGLLKIPGQQWGDTNFQFTFKDDWVSTSNGYHLKLRAGVNPQMMEVSRGATISGQVLDADGQPLKDALVRLASQYETVDADILELQSLYPVGDQENQGRFISSDNSESALTSEPADATGKFKIERIRNGVYHWMVKADGFVSRLGGVIRVRDGQAIVLDPIKLQPIQYGKLDIVLNKDAKEVLKSGDVLWQMTPLFSGPDADKRTHICTSLHLEFSGNHTFTDKDEGKLPTIEKLPEGHYRLEIIASQSTPNGDNSDILVPGDRFEFICEDLEIKGASADVAPAKRTMLPESLFLLIGNINGLDPKAVHRTGIKILAMPEKKVADLIAIHYGFYNSFDALLQLFDGMNSWHVAAVQKDGTYELKLRAGRYVLMMCGEGECVFQYGIAVPKTATAPEVTWKKSERVGLTHLTVKVLGPDRQPLENVGITLHFKNGFEIAISNTIGISDFNSEGIPDYVAVYLAGYQRAKVDLSQLKGVVVQEVVLQKSAYGNLRVNVQDEAGAPLVGTLVFFSEQQLYNGVLGQKRFKTDEQGNVEYRHLREGTRHLKILRDGYFIETPSEVTIKRDETVALKVVLKKGLDLSGTVTLPADYKLPVQIEIYTQYMGKQITDSILVENGKFTFSGLPPGDYRIIPTAIGLVLDKPVKVKLRGDGKIPEPVVLNFMRGSALALNVPKNWAGQTIQLLNAAEWSPTGTWLSGSSGEDGIDQTYHPPGIIDVTGRVEFQNVRSDDYLVGFMSRDFNNSNYSEYGYNYESSSVSATKILGRVNTAKPCSAKEMSALEGPTFQDVAFTAKVQMKLKWDTSARAISFSQGWYLDSRVQLLGEKALATIHQPTPSTPWENVNAIGKIRVLGTSDTKLIPHDRSVSVINGLPAGEYKLYLHAYWNKNNEEISKEVSKPQLLKTIVLKEGETLNLDEIKLTMPPLPKAAIDTKNSADENDDSDAIGVEGQTFQP